jgi:hypothetical protein
MIRVFEQSRGTPFNEEEDNEKASPSETSSEKGK